MIVPILCDKCEQYIMAVDIDKLDYPFHSDMFSIPMDALYSRAWQIPAGPITLDLICPACQDFPFRWGDGRLGMDQYIKIRSDKDPRFAELITAENLKLKYVPPPPTKKDEILTRIRQGMSNKEIAEDLGLENVFYVAKLRTIYNNTEGKK